MTRFWTVAALVLGGLASPNQAFAAAPPGDQSGRSVIVLGEDGSLLRWTPGSSALALLSVPWSPVNDLAPGGMKDRVLILTGTSAGEGGKRSKGEGRAILLDTAPATPVAIRTISFPGQGIKATVSSDGRKAYILAYASGKDGSRASQPVGRALLHAIDLTTGKVSASASLDQAPNAIALDASGRRLFLSLKGRILSYTTSPLASSWHYRSPGINRGLALRPGGDVLFVQRERQVAVFDPRDMATRDAVKRRSRDDDATTIIALPIEAAALAFSDDGRMILAFGRGDRFAFVDGEAKWGVIAPDTPADLKGSEVVRPVFFPSATADLLLASLPGRKVVSVPSPPEFLSSSSDEVQERGEAIEAETPAAPEGQPAPAEQPAKEEPPAPPAGQPAASPPPAPNPPVPHLGGSPVATEAKALRGKVIGDRGRVRAIVIYGPDSIVREQGRALPGPDGAWEAPLPPPGTYRLVPVGERSSALRSVPSFLTVKVSGEGWTGLDFQVPESGPGQAPTR